MINSKKLITPLSFEEPFWNFLWRYLKKVRRHMNFFRIFKSVRIELFKVKRVRSMRSKGHSLSLKRDTYQMKAYFKNFQMSHSTTLYLQPIRSYIESKKVGPLHYSNFSKPVTPEPVGVKFFWKSVWTPLGRYKR